MNAAPLPHCWCRKHWMHKKYNISCLIQSLSYTPHIIYKMALILNIDTAGTGAMVALSNNETVLAHETNNEQQQHAAFVQPAIQRIMHQAGYTLQQIDAVAVSNGPGSYTGLRVGLASAKGLCYALEKPLITINTLQVMALAAIKYTNHLRLLHTQGFTNTANEQMVKNIQSGLPVLHCPMIDARRMEVFYCLYNELLEATQEPAPLILDADSFEETLRGTICIFSGNGMPKWRNICQNPHAFFADVQPEAQHLAQLAAAAFAGNRFADLAYAEPFYIKAFHDTAKKTH